ncbi:MAG TPA: flagellar assembly protein FliW [Jatrophihabitans sp.]|jgi:flagellar assembly factor FliW|nr:flagellar assembly protein FliW [Jatrophihabitans sp.]
MTTMTDDSTSRPTECLVAEIRLVEPLLGFEGHLAFELSDIDPAGILLSLRSQLDPGLRFVLTRPERFFADYAPQMEPVVLEAVGAADAAGVTVFVILTIGTGLADATANLRAPLVVADDTGRAVQVVLDDDTLSMNRPLVS